MANSKSIAFIILVLLGLPPVIIYFGLAQSTSVGMSAFCLGLLFQKSHLRRNFALTMELPPIALKFSAILLSCIILHLLVALINSPSDIFRGIFSLAPLVLLIIGGAVLALMLIRVPQAALRSGIFIAYLVLFGCALISVTRWGPPTLAEAWRRPVFPFFEP